MLPQKVVQGFVPEANRAAAPRAFPEPVVPQLPRLFLVFARGVGPNALRRQLPQVLVLVVVGRVYARNLGLWTDLGM
jgi:hypothetical protein